MGNTVLYLTDHWPYPPGESFVTNEIRDLAPHFDKVYVLPTAMMPLGEAVRPLPENCEVLTDVHDALLLKWNKMGFVGRMIAGWVTNRDVTSELMPESLHGWTGPIGVIMLWSMARWGRSARDLRDTGESFQVPKSKHSRAADLIISLMAIHAFLGFLYIFSVL